MRNLPPTRVWARAVLAAGLCLLAGCSSPPASATSAPSGTSTDGVAIAHVDQRYIPDADFRRISEYFTGQENTSGRLIERTDPKQRAGYYFILSLQWHSDTTLPAGTQADVDYILKGDPQPRHAHFVFSAPTGTSHEILLGLTGTNWTDQSATMTAWKVALEDAAGALLASQQSFLWSLPASAPTPAVAATNAEPAKPNP